jgi:hypothetical protein
VADGFTDPAELASVVRSMAAFGHRRLLLAGESERLAFDPLLWQHARGALEAVRLIRAPALGGLLSLIEPTSVVLGFDPKQGRSIAEAAPVRAPGRGNVLLLSANGLGPAMQPKAEYLFRRPAQTTDHPLSAGDAAALIFHWNASAPKPKSRETGFFARKKAKKQG